MRGTTCTCVQIMLKRDDLVYLYKLVGWPGLVKPPDRQRLCGLITAIQHPFEICRHLTSLKNDRS